MENKYSSRYVYLAESRKALGRILRECDENDIPNIKDKKCRVFKHGVSNDPLRREGEINRRNYGGLNDWSIFVHNGESCCFPFAAGLHREQNFHKWLRAAKGIVHLRQEHFPWLYDDQGSASTEIYFGNPHAVAKYMKSALLADPVELVALKECRAENKRLLDQNETLTASASEANRQLQMEKSLSSVRINKISQEILLRQNAEEDAKNAREALRNAQSEIEDYKLAYRRLSAITVAIVIVVLALIIIAWYL